MRRAASFSLGRADVLRAVSNSTRAQLKRWAPGKPIVQFPTWTDIEVFLAADSDGSKEANVILYAGALTPLKGICFLIDALGEVSRDIPTIQLRLIGNAEDREHVRSLREQVRRLGLNGSVTFQHHVPQRELAVCMGRAQVFVLPSLSEGLPRVVAEAMACGTPVTGSDVGGIPELIENGVTGFLVPPGDVEALADRIRWVLGHPDETQAMGRRARERAARLFSLEAYWQGYASLFEIAMHAVRRRG
jgi:glycosyltransferase involved in cell wall biosynthesis